MSRARVRLYTACALLMAYLAAAAGNAAVLLRGAGTYALMCDYADASYFGISAAQYPAIAAALTAYMKGQSDTPQLTVTAFGQERLLYNARELTHLADVRALLPTLYGIVGVCMALMAVCLWLSLRAPGTAGQKRVDRRWGILLGHVPLLALGLWAVLDFNSLFRLLHRIFFRNELWLLDPRTDVLITLMPQGYFEALGGRMLARLGIVPAVLLGLLLGQGWVERKR